MRQKGTILWILILLAALFLGPTVILNRMADTPDPELRTVVLQERLIDAPASLPVDPPQD